MRTRNGNLHLEIQTSRKSPVGILRTSFRDKASGKMRHTQHGRIAGCTLEQLKLLQLAFREKVRKRYFKGPKKTVVFPGGIVM